MNEDFYGTKRKRGDPAWVKLPVFMFRYERVNLTRKFTIVAGIVSLIKKICKRDGPLRAVFKVKTVAVLFPPYPRKMKTNTAKSKSAANLSLACFYGNPSALFRTRTHLTAVGLWPGPTPEVRDSRTSRHSAHAQRQVWPIWLVLVSIYCVLHKPIQNSKSECRWTWPEVAILGADQKERGLWGRECSVTISAI